MARIVTYVHLYKRPPRKRKAVALEMPTVVATQKSRRPPEGATAEAIPRSPRLHDGAPQPSTARNAECDSTVTIPPPTNDTRKPAIVTARRGKRITAAPSDDGEASPSVKAFFARMIRPRGSDEGWTPPKPMVG
jgi:hypothetical protein